MSDLVVLDNAEAEVSVIVDLDTLVPLSIVAAGAPRGTFLQAFMSSTPFDIAVLDQDNLRAAFNSFLSTMAEVGEQPSPDDTYSVVEPTGDAGNEQVPRNDPWPVQGAQPVTAPAGEVNTEPKNPVDVVKVQCWNCNGQGMVTLNQGEPPAPCTMCGGNGWVERQAV